VFALDASHPVVNPDYINELILLPRLRCLLPIQEQMTLQVMPDDYSKLVPPLPIPNRTVKRLRADDSAATSVKVGHRQACYSA
jgi:hypothetical protein